MAYDPDLDPILDELRSDIAAVAEDAAEARRRADAATGANSKTQTALDALTTRVAKLESVPNPNPQPELLEAIDFAQGNAGFNVAAGDLIGKGSAVTTLRVKPGSSTKPPVTETGKTTPYRVVRLSGVGGADQPGVEARGFTVEGYRNADGTPGQNAHGLTIGYTTGAVVSDVRVLGATGTSSTPPGETFNLEIWQGFSPTIADVFIDGQDVAGTLLGFNSVEQGRVERFKATRTTKGFGAAIWQSGSGDPAKPLLFDRLDLRGVRRAFNFEQCYGYIRLERPDLRDRRDLKDPDIVVASAGNYTPVRGPMKGVVQTSGVKEIVIYEPVWDRGRGRPLTIGVPNLGGDYGAGQGKHAQAIAAVVVVIDGVTYRGAVNNSVLRTGNYWG